VGAATAGRARVAAVMCGAIVLVAALATGLLVRGRREAGGLEVWEIPGKPGRYETNFSGLGTDVRLVACAEGKGEARRMMEAAVAPLRAVEDLMSTYDADSEISRLNRSGAEAAVELSEPTLAVLRKSVEMAELTGGAFDVTYAPLRALWRRAQEDGLPPAQDAVADALAAVGQDKLLFDGQRVSFAASGMEVDLGGIAKGYAIDQAAEAMMGAGVTAGLVDVGGDIRLIGVPEGKGLWRVQVRPVLGVPEDVILTLPACAVATSGDYARGFRVGEQWFSHIIDPRTGWPVEGVPSVTVVAPDAVTADALATALSVMSPDEGISLVDSLAGMECMILLRLGDGAVSRRLSLGFDRFLGAQ